MIDYFLRAESKETLHTNLLEAGILVENEGEFTSTVALYCVGVIYEPTGDLDVEGIPLMEPIEGYHANIRGNLTQEQIDILPIIPHPNNPRVVFAS